MALPSGQAVTRPIDGVSDGPIDGANDSPIDGASDGPIDGRTGGAQIEELSPARLRATIARMSRWLRPTAAAGTLTATEVDILIVAEKRGPARMSDLAFF